MKIAINYNPAIYGERAIKRHTFNLVQGLNNINCSDEFLLYFSRASKNFNFPQIKFHKNFKKLKLPVPGKIIHFFWDNFNLPLLENLFFEKIDIMFYPDFEIIPTKAKKLFWVHGLAYKVIPELLDKTMVEKANHFLDRIIKHYDYFLAVSESTKQDLLKYTSIKEDKIFVLYHGIDKKFRKIENQIRVNKYLEKRFNIKSNYILYTGAVADHKNIMGILESARILKEKYKINKIFVLAGPISEHIKKYKKFIKENSLEDNIMFTGNIEQDNDDLLYLYNGAEIFLFPSFYEGLAGPPVEALKCKTPVIVSDIPANKELCKDAALYCDTHNSEDIADKIKLLLENNKLKQKLLEKSKNIINYYTWENSAKEFLNICEKIL